MDLDDILNKADNFDTEAAVAPGGTSSGGEAFLAQFAAIQDVKNDTDDLSWEDIIPVEERVKMDEEESRALQAEEMAGSRKRAAARAPGAYEGMDEADGEPAGSKTASPSEKKLKVSGPRKSNAQRAIELKGKWYCWSSLTTRRSGSSCSHSRFAEVGSNPHQIHHHRGGSKAAEQEPRCRHPDLRRHFVPS